MPSFLCSLLLILSADHLKFHQFCYKLLIGRTRLIKAVFIFQRILTSHPAIWQGRNERITCRLFQTRPGSFTHFIGWNSVLQQHLIVRETGKYNLTMYSGGKENRFGDDLALHAMVHTFGHQISISPFFPSAILSPFHFPIPSRAMGFVGTLLAFWIIIGNSCIQCLVVGFHFLLLMIVSLLSTACLPNFRFWQ